MAAPLNLTHKVYTVSEFADAIDKHPDYVRKCCQEAPYPGGAEGRHRLPEGWKAQKNRTGQWEIHPATAGRPMMDAESLVVLDALRDVLGLGNVASIGVARWMMVWGRLEPYLTTPETPEVLRALCDFEKEQLNAFADSELAAQLSRRWAKGIHIKKPSDVAVSIGAQSQSATQSPPANIEALLDRIGEAFRIAGTMQKPIDISIRIKADGSWSAAGDESQGGSPFDLLYSHETTSIFGEHRADSMAALYLYVWTRDLVKKIDDSAASGESMDTPFVLNHARYQEFASRCIYCGKSKIGRHSQARYHNPEAERASYARRLDRVRDDISEWWQTCHRQISGANTPIPKTAREHFEKWVAVVLENVAAHRL
ncbi:MAG TPA: hypothetical protein V6D22_25085 [Candidatus Obscuribacterales bacterium]